MSSLSCRRSGGAEGWARAPRKEEAAKELREHLPPASAGKDAYTLLKFYNLTSSVLSSVIQVRILLQIQFVCNGLRTTLKVCKWC